MKLVTFSISDQCNHWGIVENDEVIQINIEGCKYDTLLSFIEGGDEAFQALDEQVYKINPRYPLSDVKIKAPIRPKKNILCVGKNYKEHALEMMNHTKGGIPEHPVFFTKPHTSIIAQHEAIQSYPELTNSLDYEGELAVVIGKKGSNIAKEDAEEYIFGYTILNDITARDLQKKHQQFFKGKSLDTFAPLGPYIVHKHALADAQSLQIKTYVNDECRQNGNTRDMIFSIAEIIETLSKGMTLEPGDIIATGTPSGVGQGMNPPSFLKSGDRVRIEIEGIGELENPVV